ncbi:MAG TPA: FAD-dependent oxidoreductase [Polyangiales bacterium]|jgi:protoporphyrinogen oxidase|nr:FAD-dependent oxidoreductase [Polyangiales bacterium]
MAFAPIQILGSGLTGMSAARHLGDGYDIHEKLGHVGGHAITTETKGFRFDRTGHLLHLRDAEIRKWVDKLVGHDCVLVQRKSRIWSHGVYTRYPYQANTFGLPPDIAYECLMGYFAALQAEASTPEPKTFEDFCLKFFGAGFSKHFMIPYNEKLWGIHPRDVTAEWCSRFVPRPKLEDVIAGAVGKNDVELGYNTSFLYPSRGIGALPTAMHAELSQPVRFQHAPKAIDWRNKQLVFADGNVPYRALISTMPMDTLIATLLDPPKEIAEAGKKLRVNPLYYLDVALDVPCGVDLHWVYVPEQRYPFYRVGCYSHFSPQMAPPGKANLYVELSSRKKPDMKQLLPEVAAALVEMSIIQKPEQVLFANLELIDHAYVVYDHSYFGALALLRPFLEENRIISSGRYGGWNYSSMEDALLFGRDAAKSARELTP